MQLGQTSRRWSSSCMRVRCGADSRRSPVSTIARSQRPWKSSENQPSNRDRRVGWICKSPANHKTILQSNRKRNQKDLSTDTTLVSIPPSCANIPHWYYGNSTGWANSIVTTLISNNCRKIKYFSLKFGRSINKTGRFCRVFEILNSSHYCVVYDVLNKLVVFH